MTPTLDTTADKFRELILYVARETEGDESCGATKLNKILFYADFRAYQMLGRSISGQTYQKLQHGPAPRGIVPAVEAMEENKECVWADRNYFGLPQKKLVALREADLGGFTASEIDVVRDVIDEMRSLSGRQTSDLSHEFVGWQAADYGDDILYETVFVGEMRELSGEEREWAAEAADRHLDGDDAARPFDC